MSGVAGTGVAVVTGVAADIMAALAIGVVGATMADTVDISMAVATASMAVATAASADM